MDRSWLHILPIQLIPSQLSGIEIPRQAREYRARVNVTLYNQGIISQDQFARDMGYEAPDQPEPREPVEADDDSGTGDTTTGKKKKKREDDKDKSDRRTRDKNNPNPKRGDQDSKPR